MSRIIFLAALSAMITSTASAGEKPTLADLAFLEGHWRGGDENLVFEEIWSAPEGGVMTAMARGVSAGEKPGKLRVLEYVLVTEQSDGVIMRFKHFNADYSTWEDNGPVTLVLTDAKPGDLTFTADPPSETVKSIRYSTPEKDTVQADIVVVHDGEDSGFTLIFERIEK